MWRHWYVCGSARHAPLGLLLRKPIYTEALWHNMCGRKFGGEFSLLVCSNYGLWQILLWQSIGQALCHIGIMWTISQIIEIIILVDCSHMDAHVDYNTNLQCLQCVYANIKGRLVHCSCTHSCITICTSTVLLPVRVRVYTTARI